ncbi:2-amino-4-hydroxy-6-hydroxymethyldihydropteridine diphosphokinase [Stieleria varia]|uniref:2-amino-4-hydroxy-6-hydroxymethyldihydropteridine pyrophosphokinase n=1 Tax=Stieleria varia TaxID=2528005 RepID=A0A5C6AY50_9BACT|nr:2-amino-4-hydroxy-6-hydroxymethyldihydropteridine diphosphokinase [Stieleria varia]TWU04965.1 2-amino-4-hydroxy-6-hydroxymethyldihydropteridine pyrophosphokinase [Stieleria varia]
MKTDSHDRLPPINQCLVSFGSNLGDRHRLIADAAALLSQSAVVADSSLDANFRASRLFQTPPIGGPGGQEPFLNAVAAFDTRASAREVLLLLQHLETELGRQRKRRWDARSIDLDVVLHGQLVGGGTGLIVPHPRYTARQFVLQPACDVAAEFRDPRFGWTLQRLAEHLNAGVPSIALVGGDLETRAELCRLLQENHGMQTFAARPLPPPMAVVGNTPAAILREGNRSGNGEQPLHVDRPAVFDQDTASPKGPSQQGSNGDWFETGEPIISIGDQPWVSAYLPKLPSLQSQYTTLETVPRLVARMHRTTAETQWPAPHQMWPAGWRWPEYRLEIDDLVWAASELASAMQSMRCDVTPVTADGQWWC